MDSQNKIEETQEINLLELLHVLLKRKMFIVKVCAIAAVVSVAYSLTLPAIFSATARVLPPQKDAGGGLSALLGQAGGLAGLAAAGFSGGSDLYVGILKSRSVGDAVIQKFELQKVYQTETLDDTRRIFNKAVKVQAEKDGIITITTEDRDPKRSALLANALVEELGRTTVRLNLTKAGVERVFLEKRLELVQKDLKAAENDLKSFSEKNKIVHVDSQARASIEGIANLKAELASKEVELSVLRSKQTEESSEVKALLSGINRLKREIGRLAGSDGDTQGIPSVGSVPQVGLDYSRKLRELKTQEAILEQLTKQYEMAKLSEAKDSSTLQVLDDAVVPVRKSKPKRSFIVILATVSACFLSILYVLGTEFIAKLSADDRKIVENIKRQAFALK